MTNDLKQLGERSPSCACEVNAADQKITVAVYYLEALDCPSEEALLRQHLAAVVQTIHVDFEHHQLTLSYTPDKEAQVVAALAATGMRAQKITADDMPPDPPAKSLRPVVMALILACSAEVAIYGAKMQEDWAWLQFLGMALAVMAIILSGAKTYRQGWQALKSGRISMNALMSIAVTGAFLLGEWAEAAMVMALFTLAEWLENRAVVRSRDAAKTLLALTPPQVLCQQDHGAWQVMDAEKIKIGALIRVAAGERVAVDGVIEHGQTALDQSPMTGESLPVEKGVGDAVFAGSINLTGAIDLRVTAHADDSLMRRIIHAVNDAESQQAPTQRLMDRFAARYTPAIVVLALVTALLLPLMDGAWLYWIERALTILVIACPCALVIATPVTVVSGLTAALRQGMVVKGGVYLETLHAAKTIAFDKTGTLSYGKPKLVAYGATIANAHAIARALAMRSHHPVAQAIAEGLDITTSIEISALEEQSGAGISAQFGNKCYVLGSTRLIDAMKNQPDITAAWQQAQSVGCSISVLSDGNQILAWYGVADTLKSEAHEALTRLHRMDIALVMLTGDHTISAQRIAQKAGIETVYANLLPEDKQQVIQHLRQTTTQPVIMVGDGINDMPALAAADIGMAMGKIGSDSAIETADIALMDDNLHKIADLVGLSQKTWRLMWQNIVFALTVKIIFLLLTFVGITTMWLAVVADVGVTLMVVANGMRLLRWRPPRH